VPRQIANANTFFNIANTVLFIGFSTWFARLAKWLVKDKPVDQGVIIKAKFLDEAALVSPPLAMQQARLELGRAGWIVHEMLEMIVPAARQKNLKVLSEIERRDDAVDVLEAEIMQYLAKVHSGTMSDQESLEFQGLISAVDNMESLADVIETDLVAIARQVTELDRRSGQKTRAMLTALYETVLESVKLTVQAVEQNDQNAAESVMLLKGTISSQADELLARKARRLAPDDPNYLKIVRIEMSVIDHLRHIYTLAKRISKTVLPPALAQRD
jgi:phosphate:Na+ symporter